MVYDTLNRLCDYKGWFASLDVLIDWLETHDLRELPLGRTDILEGTVYALVMDATTKPLDQARFEMHKKYMDLQVDLEGSECFSTTAGPVVPLDMFDDVADKGYFSLENGHALEGDDVCAARLDVCTVRLGGSRFALSMAGEYHMPNVTPPGEDPATIRKICFKLASPEQWELLSKYI